MLLKKEKFKAVIYCSSARELNQPTAYSRAARFRVPGRNLGLGRDSSLPPRPNSARALRAVDRDPTVVREDRRNKTPSRPLLKTLGLTLFLCFSLFAALHTTVAAADDSGTGAMPEMAPRGTPRRRTPWQRPSLIAASASLARETRLVHAIIYYNKQTIDI